MDLAPMISRLSGLTPNQRLILYELAAFRHPVTGSCRPAVSTLAQRSGLTLHNVKQILRQLSSLDLIARQGDEFTFPAFTPAKPEPVPDDYWPSDTAIDALLAQFPHHHFPMEDAVHDFIRFCRERGTCIPPADLDAAFVRNISLLLQRRQPGDIEIRGRDSRNPASSVGAFLAGL